MDKLSTGDKLIFGGGIAYFICMFLPWYGLSGGSNSGWDYFLGGVIPLILIAVMVAHVGVTTFTDTEVPEPPVPWNQVHRGLGVAAAVIVLLRLIIGSDIDLPFGAGSVDLDRKFGLFLALISAIVVAAGGFTRDDEGPAPAAGGNTGSAPF